MDDATVEIIARRWCALTGEDANRNVQVHRQVDGDTLVDFVPYWKIAAQEIVPMFAWMRCYFEFMSGKRAEEPQIVIPN